MKKKGIINGQLAGEIAALGHGDLILLCNSKMQVPRDIVTIDLAVTKDLPTISQVLGAILEEVEIEYYFYAEELRDDQPEYYSNLRVLLPEAKEDYSAAISFKSYIRNVKFAIRTGDSTPYGSLILRAGEV